MKRKVFILILAVLAAIPAYYLLVLLWFMTIAGPDPLGVMHTAGKTRQIVEDNNQNFVEIIENEFDRAKGCKTRQCQQDVSGEINTILGRNKTRIPFYEGTYFVRLGGEEKLEKMFLSGVYKEETVDTDGERSVARFLLNNSNYNYLKQYPFQEFTKSMIFLKDRYSEAEIIIPVKKDGKIVGAVVQDYGD